MSEKFDPKSCTLSEMNRELKRLASRKCRAKEDEDRKKYQAEYDRLVKIKNDRFQTISAHSLDNRPLAESGSILLLHITNTAATDMRFYDSSRRMLESWGKLPLLVERGRAELSLRHRDSAKLKIDALAWDGSVRSRIPATVSAGTLRFTADTANGGNMIYHIHK